MLTPGHQHPALGRVQETSAQRRVPILQQQVDPFDSERQKLADRLGVGVEGHGPVADGLAGIFFAAFEDRPFDDDGVLEKGNFEDRRVGRVQLRPLVVLVSILSNFFLRWQ
jgi:hypothetical protein